jgi:cleavage and polyadenylation specificity factor subunit 1
MSFAIHKQVHPPTGVDHAVAAYFTHPVGDEGPPNLVVTQANHLTIFAIRREASASATTTGADDTAAANAAVTAAALAAVRSPEGGAGGGAAAAGGEAWVSLEVVAEFDLHGTVGSIAVLRRRFGAPRNQRDALLIAVRESKLSVVEFDPATMSLVNSSLHSWVGAPPPRTRDIITCRHHRTEFNSIKITEGEGEGDGDGLNCGS